MNQIFIDLLQTPAVTWPIFTAWVVEPMSIFLSIL